MSTTILGTDFLCAHGLLVDVRNQRLITQRPLPYSPGLTAHPVQPVCPAPLHFPALTQPTFSSGMVRRGVEHHIMTLGPPIHGQARFLDPETLAMAKAEFEMLEYHGIVRHSDSLWATPLHRLIWVHYSCYLVLHIRTFLPDWMVRNFFQRWTLSVAITRCCCMHRTFPGLRSSLLLVCLLSFAFHLG